MKKVKIYFIIGALFFAATLSLLTVDRHCSILYQKEDTISNRLQLFIENMLDLH